MQEALWICPGGFFCVREVYNDKGTARAIPGTRIVKRNPHQNSEWQEVQIGLWTLFNIRLFSRK